MQTLRDLQRRMIRAGAIALSIGLGAGFVFTATVANSSSSDEPRPLIGGMPSDADGDGLISDTGDERIPELIAAVGDKGVLGYIRFEDLEGTSEPSSPDQALEETPRVIPIYAEDGVTVIDHLSSAGGDPVSITEESPTETPSPSQ